MNKLKYGRCKVNCDEIIIEEKTKEQKIKHKLH